MTENGGISRAEVNALVNSVREVVRADLGQFRQDFQKEIDRLISSHEKQRDTVNGQSVKVGVLESRVDDLEESERTRRADNDAFRNRLIGWSGIVASVCGSLFAWIWWKVTGKGP